MTLTTQKQVDRMKEPGKYRCGPNLWLEVKSATSKSYLFRWWREGREFTMGLGSTRTWSRDEMMEQARLHRQCVARGGNPKEEREAQLAAALAKAALRLTFKETAEAYIKAHTDGWKSSKHAEQWTNTLTVYAYPILGTMMVDTITTPDVLRVLEQKYKGAGSFWRDCGVTANRVRNRMESVFSYAHARGLRSGDNPARWTGLLDQILPAQASGTHHAAMAYAELPGFMRELRARDSVTARALETLILTAVRTSELTGGLWAEVNMEERLWVIPGTRTKTGAELRIPLSDRVMAIFKALPKEAGGHIFPGKHTGAGFSNMVLSDLLKRMRPGLTVHGFRSTFRDWSAEVSHFPHEVCEQALGHAIASAVERAYRRGDLLQKRRLLMSAWATYCEHDHADVVTAMRVSR